MRSLTLLFVVSSICVSGALEVSAQKISATADAVTGQTLTVSKAAAGLLPVQIETDGAGKSTLAPSPDRAYGTWLHGDERYSISRSNRNLDGTFKLDRNVPLEEAMRDETDRPPVILNGQQRKAVHAAIKELCDRRRYALHALNVRTRSRRYLWKPRDVEAAVNYVIYCQGDISFEEWNG